MTKISIRKYLICLILAIITFTVSIFSDLDYPLSLVLAWDTFGICYVVMSLYIFSSLTSREIRMQSAAEDVSSLVLFGLVIAACLTGLMVVLTLFSQTSQWQIPKFWGSLSCIAAIAFSWMMVHTSFAFRYAHLFYGDDNKRFSKHARGLIFPEDNQPDYYDFAYFSFVIGMTFQVSDVVITVKGVRRLALIHSLISFVFNTVIIALTISEIVNFNAR